MSTQLRRSTRKPAGTAPSSPPKTAAKKTPASKVKAHPPSRCVSTRGAVHQDQTASDEELANDPNAEENEEEEEDELGNSCCFFCHRTMLSSLYKQMIPLLPLSPHVSNGP
jgi:hypothetical protein